MASRTRSRATSRHQRHCYLLLSLMLAAVVVMSSTSTTAASATASSIVFVAVVATSTPSTVSVLAAATNTADGGSTLIMGLGPALFAMIVLAVAFSIICVVGIVSGRKLVTFGCVVLFASVIALFFVSVSVESPHAAAVTKRQYNHMAVTRSIVAAILIGSTVVGLCSVLLLHVITPRQGHVVGNHTSEFGRPQLV